MDDPGLTPKLFVKSVRGKDLRYHVLTTIKRWYLHEDKETPMSRTGLPCLPLRSDDDKRRDYPQDTEALDRAWQVLGTKNEAFVRETVNRLRYKLKSTGYLRNEYGFCFPHPYEFRWSTLAKRAGNWDWMDHESEIDEHQPCGKDGEGNSLWRLGNGDLVYYDEMDKPVVVLKGEDRKELRVDFSSSDESETSDDPYYGMNPDDGN